MRNLQYMIDVMTAARDGKLFSTSNSRPRSPAGRQDVNVVEPIEVVLPIRTVNPLNGSHRHWRVRHSRASKERGTACMLVRLQMNLKPRLFSYPVIVTLTRLSASTMDDDNLNGTLKSVRDGIADAFECDDSSRSRLRFVYCQEKCKRGAFGVKVRIE